MSYPKAVTRWLSPEGMTGHVHAFEAKEGGRYRMALVYDKSEHGNRGKTSDETDIVEGRFVELRPKQKWVELSIMLTRPIDDARVSRRIVVSRGRFAYFFRLRSAADVDDDLRELLTESCLAF